MRFKYVSINQRKVSFDNIQTLVSKNSLKRIWIVCSFEKIHRKGMAKTMNKVRPSNPCLLTDSLYNPMKRIGTKWFIVLIHDKQEFIFRKIPPLPLKIILYSL